MRQPRGGSTLVEVVVAIMVLTVGVLALAGTPAALDRLIVRGRRLTQAAQLGEQVLDSLRRQATGELRACSALRPDPVGYTQQSVRVSWDVGALTSSGGSRVRQVRVILTYAADRRVLADTVSTLLRCDA